VKIVLIVLAVVVVAILAVVVVGLFLPRDHVATRTALFDAKPVDVWRVVTDFEKGPEWRTGLKSVEILEPVGGRRRYREVSGFGPVTYIVEEERPPTRLVGRIADEDQGFGGSWTWEIAPEGEKTRVTITERGFISNPVFRFLARFVFGYGKTMETYLRDLRRRLGG